jgi:hypothetical protein
MRKPLRVWPAAAIAVAQVAAYLVSPILVEDALLVSLAAVMAGGLLTLLWWLFFSRAPWLERIGAVLLMALAVVLARPAADPSISGAGQGMLMYVLGVPVTMFALAVWAVATRRLQDRTRRIAFAGAVVAACTPFLVARTAGSRGGSLGEFHWRWTPTPEERLLAEVKDDPLEPIEPPASATGATSVPSAAPANVTPAPAAPIAPAAAPAPIAPAPPAAPAVPARAEWPGFRGPLRDGVVRDVRINTDWSAAPPAELRRRPIGPGWS